MAPLQINVVGKGTKLRPAERAILILQAESSYQKNPADASAIVTETANTIRERIEPHCPQEGQTSSDSAIAHYSMTTLDTNHTTRLKAGKDKEYEDVYYARADFHIKFSDFDVLNTLATEISAMQNVKIKRIDWSLTDATLDSIKSGARKLAAEDVIQRAYDYAEVFGRVPKEELSARVRATEIKEDNYYRTGTKPQLHYGKKQRHGMLHVDKSELQFQPEDVRLEVSVDGKFVVDN